MINYLLNKKIVSNFILYATFLSASLSLYADASNPFAVAQVQSVDQNSFSSLSRSDLVIVEYYAEWCGPCKKLKPLYEDVAHELSAEATFAKVNFDHAKKLAKSQNVTTLPTLIIYRHGKEIKRRGPGTKNEISHWIRSEIK